MCDRFKPRNERRNQLRSLVAAWFERQIVANASPAMLQLLTGAVRRRHAFPC